MVAAVVEPLTLYRPRNPRASGLWQLLDGHFETFRRVYDVRFADKYGFWRPIVERSVAAFLGCGDLHEGFACVRCGDCGHEMFGIRPAEHVFLIVLLTRHYPRPWRPSTFRDNAKLESLFLWPVYADNRRLNAPISWGKD